MMKYKKVVIVDDEFLIREYIDEKTNWSEFDCQVVLKASSALEVFDYFEEDEADIIITDINMPVINGLQMSEKLKQDYPKLKVIVLTGYDEFEYAKKGIDIGVDGYLLKPVDDQEINKVLQKVVNEIKDEGKRDVEIEFIRQQMKLEQPFIQERLFFDLVSNKVSAQKAIDRSKYCDFILDSDFYQVALIDFVPRDARISDDEGIYIAMLKVKIQLQELVSEYNVKKRNIYLFSNEVNQIYIYSIDESMNIKQELKFFGYENNDDHDIDMIVGIGKSVNKLSDLSSSYHQASQAVSFGRIKRTGTIYDFDELGLVMDSQTEDSYFDTEVDSLKFYIKAGLSQQAKESVDNLFAFIEKKSFNVGLQPTNILRIYLSKITTNVELFVISLDFKLREEILKASSNMSVNSMENIFQADTIQKANTMVLEYVMMITKSINKFKSHEDSDVVHEVDQYIEAHAFESELSLKKVSEVFFINSSYLSRIYKQKMGLSFKEKVIKLRMDKALELLHDQNLKVYEVSNQVGIVDPNYFSMCFKKFMNQSVTEYRKNITKGI